jgi:hypothetical protein
MCGSVLGIFFICWHGLRINLDFQLIYSIFRVQSNHFFLLTCTTSGLYPSNINYTHTHTHNQLDIIGFMSLVSSPYDLRSYPRTKESSSWVNQLSNPSFNSISLSIYIYTLSSLHPYLHSKFTHTKFLVILLVFSLYFFFFFILTCSNN